MLHLLDLPFLQLLRYQGNHIFIFNLLKMRGYIFQLYSKHGLWSRMPAGVSKWPVTAKGPRWFQLGSHTGDHWVYLGSGGASAISITVKYASDHIHSTMLMASPIFERLLARSWCRLNRVFLSVVYGIDGYLKLRLLSSAFPLALPKSILLRVLSQMPQELSHHVLGVDHLVINQQKPWRKAELEKGSWSTKLRRIGISLPLWTWASKTQPSQWTTRNAWWGGAYRFSLPASEP